MKRYFMSECIATHVSFLPLIRAIACLLRVYYAFDLILINSLLYVSSFINNILIIFIFNNYKTLSRSYQKKKKLCLALFCDRTKQQSVRTSFCLFLCLCLCSCFLSMKNIKGSCFCHFLKRLFGIENCRLLPCLT